MKNKKLLLIAAAGMLLLTGCKDASSAAPESVPEQSAAETAETEPVSSEPEEKVMVTLGDSISFGYGMDDYDNERYSGIVCNTLTERDGIKWHDYNYAISGDDSSDLVFRLERGRAVKLPSADRIIMYIGANNLLGVYSDYMTELTDKYEIEDYTEITDSQLEQIQADLQEAMQDQDKFRAELQQRLDTNIEKLSSDLEQIYTMIREKNPDAEFYVLNIYNPYVGVEQSELYPSEENFGDFAQSQIDRANTVIADFEAAHSDLIPVDIAAAFAKADPAPIIGKTEIEIPEDVSADISEVAGQNYIDPHPNKEGQKLIAETVLAEMEKHS